MLPSNLLNCLAGDRRLSAVTPALLCSADASPCQATQIEATSYPPTKSVIKCLSIAAAVRSTTAIHLFSVALLTPTPDASNVRPLSSKSSWPRPVLAAVRSKHGRGGTRPARWCPRIVDAAVRGLRTARLGRSVHSGPCRGAVPHQVGRGGRLRLDEFGLCPRPPGRGGARGESSSVLRCARRRE